MASGPQGPLFTGAKGAAEDALRYPLLPSTRYLIPVAIFVGLCGAALASGLPRQVYFALSMLILGLWIVGRLRRPVLILDDEGYRVEVARRVKLRVRFDEVKKARAVPVERAMYLDCGDPRRNLLLPPRHGYGFRFQHQGALYALLAKRLEDRLEIADKLIPDHSDDKQPPSADPPSPPKA